MVYPSPLNCNKQLFQNHAHTYVQQKQCGGCVLAQGKFQETQWVEVHLKPKYSPSGINYILITPSFP